MIVMESEFLGDNLGGNKFLISMSSDDSDISVSEKKTIVNDGE